MDLPSSIFQDPSLDERTRSEISHDASLGILSACLVYIDLSRDFEAGESGNYMVIYANSRCASISVKIEGRREDFNFRNSYIYIYIVSKWLLEMKLIRSNEIVKLRELSWNALYRVEIGYQSFIPKFTFSISLDLWFRILDELWIQWENRIVGQVTLLLAMILWILVTILVPSIGWDSCPICNVPHCNVICFINLWINFDQKFTYLSAISLGSATTSFLLFLQ